MNTSEGLRRIATVVRWIGYFFAAVMLVVAGFAFGNNIGDAMVFGAGAAIPAAVGWGLGWIIDGFAAPKS